MNAGEETLICYDENRIVTIFCVSSSWDFRDEQKT